MSGAWPLQPLGSVCEINPRTVSGGLATSTEVTFVPMSFVDESEGRIVRRERRTYGEVSKGYVPFRDGDVLFARITPCMQNGKAAIASDLTNGVGFGSTEFHVIRPGPRVLAEWVFALVRQACFRAAAEASFTGTAGQQRVPASFMARVPIPVPPLPEQGRIVKLLDAAEELRRLRTAADHRTADLIPALFHEIFGDPTSNPKRWDVVEMREILDGTPNYAP